MLPEYFTYIGAFITSLGGLTYLIYTIQGKVQPNRVTWFLWGLAPLIAFAAQVKQGVGIPAIYTLIIGVEPLIILAASFLNKKAYWKAGRFDYACGTLSIGGLILWQLTGVGNIAIFFSIIADIAAAIPTLVKSFYEPESESWIAYFGTVIGAGLTVLTVKNLNFETLGFPVYLLIINALLAFLIYTKIGKGKNLLKNI